MPNHYDQYRIIRMGGRPIFAIPVARRRVRLAATRRFQVTTWKRAVFQRAIRGAIVAGIDRWLWPATDGPLDDSADREESAKFTKFNFASWLNELRGVLKEPTIVAAVVWPPQAGRGRVYVHLLAASGDPVAFAKIAFDAANDHCLAVEAETLRQLQSLSFGQCHPPALLAESMHNGHRYVVLEPLPENARPVERSWRSYPSDCVAQYAGQHERLTAEKVADLDWWKAYQHGSSVGGADTFTQELNNAIQDGLDVCRVHGDLGPGNLVLESNSRRLWLFDWENSHPRGPKLTDRVNFFIAISQATILNDPVRGLRELAAHFFSADPRFARKDVLAALAYLHTVDIRGATALIQQWDRLPT